MTRERAISDLAAWFYKSEFDDWETMKVRAAKIIDIWVSDGALTLYEPKSPITIMCETLKWGEGGLCHQQLIEAMDIAGLKIVEK